MAPGGPGRVVVLGAGLAGLSAADVLVSHGVRTVVVEKEAAPGGLAATCRVGGFHFDFGPHRFHTRNPAVLARVSALLGGDLLQVERLSRIRLLDRYFLYPLSLGDVLRRMPLRKGAAMMASYVARRGRRLFGGLPDDSFETWVVNRFGRCLYDIYFGPYTAKLWGIPPSSLSPDWASQRITVPSLTGLVRETLFPRGEKGARSLVSTFHYPRGGIGRISEAFAARVREGGGALMTSVEPLSISRGPGGFVVETTAGALEADGLISSIPVTRLAELAAPMLDERSREAAASLSYRSIVFVTLRLAKRPEPRDHWIYTPEDCYRFNRLSIPENFDPSVSESGGQVVFEFTCQEGDPIWNGGEALAAECVSGGERLGLFRTGEVMGHAVTRQAHAYPIYDRGYEVRSGILLEAFDALPGIVTCGRQGLFRYNNMDHSIEMGEYAALELLGIGTLRERFDWTRSTWADG